MEYNCCFMIFTCVYVYPHFLLRTGTSHMLPPRSMISTEGGHSNTPPPWTPDMFFSPYQALIKYTTANQLLGTLGMQVS